MHKEKMEEPPAGKNIRVDGMGGGYARCWMVQEIRSLKLLSISPFLFDSYYCHIRSFPLSLGACLTLVVFLIYTVVRGTFS